MKLTIEQFLDREIAKDEIAADDADTLAWTFQAESDSAKGRARFTIYSLSWPRDRVFAVARLTALSATEFIQHIVRQHPLRTIAEAKAKGQMVSLHSEDDDGDCTCCGEPYPCRSLRILAEIFDEEPDFDQDWRYEEH